MTKQHEEIIQAIKQMVEPQMDNYYQEKCNPSIVVCRIW